MVCFFFKICSLCWYIISICKLGNRRANLLMACCFVFVLSKYCVLWSYLIQDDRVYYSLIELSSCLRELNARRISIWPWSAIQFYISYIWKHLELVIFCWLATSMVLFCFWDTLFSFCCNFVIIHEMFFPERLSLNVLYTSPFVTRYCNTTCFGHTLYIRLCRAALLLTVVSMYIGESMVVLLILVHFACL